MREGLSDEALSPGCARVTPRVAVYPLYIVVMDPSDDGDAERQSLVREENRPSTENRGLTLLVADASR